MVKFPTLTERAQFDTVLIMSKGEVFVRARHKAAMGLILVSLIAGCSSTDQPATGTTPAATAASGASAQDVVDAITAKWPAPNPQDNTGSCAAKPDSTAAGCVKLITTDAVSVYEFADDATAARWVAAMKKAGDWRQAGRFALAWTAREQALTDKDTRTDMVKIASGVAAKS